MIISSILKGIGALDKLAGASGIDRAAKFTADKLIGKDSVIPGVVGSAFRKVEGVEAGAKSKDTLIQRAAGFKMKKAAGIGIAATAGLYNLSDETYKANNASKIGSVQAEELANTIGSNHSPTIGTKLDELDNSEEASQRFQKNNLPLDSYGAQGDLVFALHGLR